MVDFTRLQATAKRLVEANGRTVTLQADPSGLLNPSEPERGPDFSGGPTEVSVIASFVPATGGGLGRAVDQMFNETLLQGFEQVALLAATSLTGPTLISEFDRLKDGSDSWKIKAVQILKPADDEIVYALGLTR